MDRLERAIEEWRQVLPAEAVLSGDALDVYRVNCLSLDRSLGACLRPVSEAQVVKIVQIASRYKVPLYAISTGHNWGYGTSLPVTENCVIVDLSRMNRILQMDPELGLITLEPGVTQGQLFEYLSTAKLNFFVPTTGAGPTASIVGNALERGFGMTPETDHFAAVASVRALLPTAVSISLTCLRSARQGRTVFGNGVSVPISTGCSRRGTLGSSRPCRFRWYGDRSIRRSSPLRNRTNGIFPSWWIRAARCSMTSRVRSGA